MTPITVNKVMFSRERFAHEPAERYREEEGKRKREEGDEEERRGETPGSLTAMHHERKENTKASSAARFFCSHCIPHSPTDQINILSAGERTYRPQGQRWRIFFLSFSLSLM